MYEEQVSKGIEWLNSKFPEWELEVIPSEIRNDSSNLHIVKFATGIDFNIMLTTVEEFKDESWLVEHGFSLKDAAVEIDESQVDYYSSLFSDLNREWARQVALMRQKHIDRVEIMFNDLSPNKQQEVLDFYGIYEPDEKQVLFQILNR